MTSTIAASAPVSAAATAPRARYAGLDGLRAIAVTLVVVYHLFPQWWLGQGFVGVDVFFVISGFLITSLLLRETDATGRIAYADFWRRRARRLVPALVTLIGVCGVWAWFVGGDVLVGLGRQVLGALTFSFNWVSIASGEGYFAQSNPELFRNLWSLALEEQFYVLWPLLLPLLLLVPRRGVRTAVMTVAALASAAWMGAVVVSGGDLTRAYFGTDTHGFGVLLGVALAFALHRPDSGDAVAPGSLTGQGSLSGQGSLTGQGPWAARRGPRALIAAAGTLALAGLVVIAALPQSMGIATFPGALLGASLLTVVVITAAVQPASPLGAALDIAPLRWIGVRSYGIYLWHWPVLVLLVAGFTGAGADTGVPIGVGMLALAITLVASALSYRFIEQPVRVHGFRGSLGRLGRGLAGGPASRFAAISLLSAGLLAACATTGAIASAPQETSAEQVVAKGAAALERASAAPSAPAEPGATAAPSATAEPGQGTASATPGAGTAGAGTGGQGAGGAAPTAEPEPAPQPTPVTGAEVSAIGDSVMLASAQGLLDRLPGIQIDAAVSRSMWAGPGIVENLAASGQLRSYVVVALGTNGPVDEASLQRVADVVGPDRHLVLVNAYAPRDWIPGVNDTLARFAAANPGVKIADWSGAIAAQTDLLAGDRIHPGPSGGRAYADAVAAAVQQVEDDRALRQFRLERDRERAHATAFGRMAIIPR